MLARETHIAMDFDPKLNLPALDVRFPPDVLGFDVGRALLREYCTEAAPIRIRASLKAPNDIPDYDTLCGFLIGFGLSEKSVDMKSIIRELNHPTKK